MKKIELLSPAGNFECLKAAVNNGADAVYLGGSNFSARAFADNFNNEQIVEAIKYAHLRNVKVYVTINTLLNEFEIDNAFKQAEYLYRNNVDGILVQDLGLLYRIRTELPGLEIHASTQMHIHNLSGVKVAKELGLKRVVLARESSLDLIKECCKEKIEIECFVHGAICVSYSGQCLMSSITKNRSANKGMCAQCCRLKYHLYQDNKLIETDTDYLLSPKDMCLLNDVPKLIEAGVSSLKIEGRMKSSAYVGYVTKCYREAIDSYYNGEAFKLSKVMGNNLKLLYNRGFTDTYLMNNNDELFSNSRPNHIGIEIGKVIDVKNDSVLIKLTERVNQFDGIRIISQIDTGLILNMIKVNGKLVSSCNENGVIEIKTKEHVNIGDKVVKTLDYKLENDILSIDEKKTIIDLSIECKPNKPIIVKTNIFDKEFYYESKENIETPLNHPITDKNIKECFIKTDEHPYKIKNIDLYLEDSFISLKKLNDIRREFYDQLDNFVLKKKDIENIPISLSEIIDFNQKSSINFKDLGDTNPLININSNYSNSKNVLIKEIGGLLLDANKNAYYTLNISNSYAFEFLLRLGFKNIILSTELNEITINELIKRFKERTDSDIKPYEMISGKRVLMNIARNPFNKYIKDFSNALLSDGNDVYEIVNNNGFVQIIEKEDISLSNKGISNALKYLE